MQIKIHDAYRTIVVLCDTELIGKTFTEGKREITIRENFYSGDEKNKQEILEILSDMKKEDATFNIVGKESVECAIETRIISKEGIITIDNIPIALVLM